MVTADGQTHSSQCWSWHQGCARHRVEQLSALAQAHRAAFQEIVTELESRDEITALALARRWASKGGT